jgi:hypothetical protein
VPQLPKRNAPSMGRKMFILQRITEINTLIENGLFISMQA